MYEPCRCRGLFLCPSMGAKRYDTQSYILSWTVLQEIISASTKITTVNKAASLSAFSKIILKILVIFLTYEVTHFVPYIVFFVAITLKFVMTLNICQNKSFENVFILHFMSHKNLSIQNFKISNWNFKLLQSK